ncbi:MAG: ATP-binding protein [Eubacteriaceae bacterium]|jgi:signal transduction histidine kinase/PAS domain-containing protein/ActR/RegA family two-component response regulator|nr:ATP-binding protein [Eubacteriaceae bacterium]
MNITDDFVQHFAEFSPIDTAIYRARGGALETMFLSENIPALLGMTRDEYLKITEKDAMDLTLPQDREGLGAATANGIATGRSFDYYYRVYSNIKGFDWVHVDAHTCGTMDGDPVIIARFANISREGGIFETILDNSDRVTVVIDRRSHEFLYANDKLYSSGYAAEKNLLNRTCYSLLCGKDAPCRNCIIAGDDQNGELHERYVFDKVNKRWNLVTWRNVMWCMHDAVIVYLKDVTPAKENEISLDRMNQMYSMAIEDSKQMLWEYDPEHRRITYQMDNPYTRMICEKVGMPAVIDGVPDSIIGMVDEEYREKFLAMFNIEELDSGGVSCEYSSTVNGNTQWWRVTSRPIYDLNKKLKTVYCSGHNITDEKQAEKNYRSLLAQLSDVSDLGIANFRLNLSRNRFIAGHAVYQSLFDDMKTVTADDHFAAAINEITDEQIKNKNKDLYNCSALIEQYRRGVRQMTLEYPVRSRLTSMSGRIRWVRSVNSLVMNPDTGDIEDITLVTEITKQKKTEKILNNMANKGCDYIGLIDTAAGTLEIFGGIWDCDDIKGSDSIVYSEALKKLSDNYVAAEERTAFAGQMSLAAVIEKLQSGDDVLVHYNIREDEKTALRKQIKCKWLDEEKCDILILQEDITEAYMREQMRMSELQDALHRAEAANKAKTEFVSRISHDIRTPISAIISMTEFAREDIEDKEKLLQDISRISDSNKFLLSLINDILDISKIDSGNIELYPECYPYDEFISSIRSIFEPMCMQKNIDFRISTGISSGRGVIVDKVRFNQVALNILSNAVKYTPDGGRISFISESELLDDGKNIKCAYTVRDTGIGMSSEFQSRMFDAFTQENAAYRYNNNIPQGTGLGLSIVKRIIDIMGGSISVKSEPGEGTAVSVSIVLPAAAEEQLRAAAAEKSDDGADDDYIGGKVLLAEDNMINTEIAIRLLEKFGIETVHAEDGAKAAAAFECSAEGEYFAILMDIQMPVMNGYEAAEIIRHMPRSDAAVIPIIAMTADAFVESAERSRKVGMNDYITKPINVNKLKSILKKYAAAKKDGERNDNQPGRSRK